MRPHKWLRESSNPVGTSKPISTIPTYHYRGRSRGHSQRHNRTRVKREPTLEQILRSEMWRTAFHDPEISETVNLHDYPLLDIGRGDVLCQGRYRHPKL
jgi:hypothetical protein